MPLKVQCVNCQNIVSVADKLKGKTIRCPFCQTATKVPGGAAPPRPQRGAPTQMARAPIEQVQPLPPRRPAPRPTQLDDGFVDEGAHAPPPPPPPRRRRPEPDYDDRPRRRGSGRRPARSSGSSGLLIVLLILIVVAALVGGGVALYIFKPEWFQWWGPPAYARYLTNRTNVVLAVNVSGTNNANLRKWTKSTAQWAFPEMIGKDLVDKSSLDKVLDSLDAVVIAGEATDKSLDKELSFEKGVSFDRGLLGVTIILQTSTAIEADIVKKAFHLGEKNAAGDRAYRFVGPETDKKEKKKTAKGKERKGEKAAEKADNFLFLDGRSIIIYRGTEEEMANLLDQKAPMTSDMSAQIGKLSRNAAWAYFTIEEKIYGPVIKSCKEDMKKRKASLLSALKKDTKEKDNVDKALAKFDAEQQPAQLKEQSEKLGEQIAQAEKYEKQLSNGLDFLEVLSEARSVRFQANFEAGALNLELRMQCDSEDSARKGAAAVEVDKLFDMLSEKLDSDDEEEAEIAKNLKELAGSFKISAEGVYVVAKAKIPEALVKKLDEQIIKNNELSRELQKKDIAIDLKNGVELDLIRIAGGEFLMGDANSSQDAKELKPHKVQINRAFYMGKYEVTRKQFVQVMGEAEYKKYYGQPLDDASANLPMGGVPLKAALEFCKELSKIDKGKKFDLPTEAEWEYACRAGTKGPNYTGEPLSKDQACFAKPISDDNPREVGKYAANPWGLYDMYGNVAEWCKADRNEEAVARGGSWRDSTEQTPTSFGRRRVNNATGATDVGFRIVLRLQ